VKKQILAAVLLGAVSAQAIAIEATGNAGFVTNYIWRGADQSNGKAAAQGGLDLTAGEGAVQFYAGTWASTVEYEFVDMADTDSISGVEVDLYTGISGELSDFSYGLGGTYITYTDNVNPDYLEANVSLGYKWFTLDTAVGKFDQPDDPLDYVFAVLTAELNGFYGKLGYTEWDAAIAPAGALADGGYFDLGYANTLQWEGRELFDYSFSYIYSEADNLTANQAGNKLVFGITKNFGILD
jgi:uncharacterized protein (TIGR02001 family)